MMRLWPKNCVHSKLFALNIAKNMCNYEWSSISYENYKTIIGSTVVPAFGDPHRERPPALYGHVINGPTDTFQR